MLCLVFHRCVFVRRAVKFAFGHLVRPAAVSMRGTKFYMSL